MQRAVKKNPLTFTDILRARFKVVLEPIAAFLNSLGFTPNGITLMGLFGVSVGALFLAVGQISIAGIIILLCAPFDALDGTMARLRGSASEFGAFLDSVTDRYAELFIFGGLLYYFLQRQDLLSCMVVFVAAGGSVLVSYIRARAQSVGYETKVGMFTRVERFLVLIPCLIFNQPHIAIWAIAIFTNITAVQRILHVYRQTEEAKTL